VKALDAYLDRVRRRMVGLDAAVREDVIRELRSHLLDAAREAGGDWASVLPRAEAPEAIARRYRDLYGYGRTYQLLLVSGAFLLGLLTLPLVPIGGSFTLAFLLSVLLLAALVAYLFWTSVAAGEVVGLLAGVAAGAGRLVVAGLAMLTGTAAFLEGGMVLFLFVSALLVVLGYLPGTAKRKWRGPRAEL
jgi:uncharacterized membrane protein